MKKIKKIVLGIKFDEDSVAAWQTLKEWDIFQDAEIQLIHFSKASRDTHYDPTSNLYPPSEELVVIENAVNSKLHSIKSKIFPVSQADRIVVKCLFDHDPRKGFCEYVRKSHADLVILAAESKKLPFGSFLQYQSLHSPADILVLRAPHKF